MRPRALSILGALGLCCLRAFAQDSTPPVITERLPAAGATVRTLATMEVFFSEDVDGVDAEDLLVNGQPAEFLDIFGSAHYVFTFPPPATGVVQFAWSPTNGITDLASNSFVATNWTITLDPKFGVPKVVISEFMASNNHTTNDVDGDASDWIELFNADTIPVNLGGWFLTDTASNLRKWRIPGYVMPANSYLLVWASNKDRTNVAAQLHANFKLDKAGEYLALVGPETNVVSDFYPVFPPQQDDVSYGRDPADPSLVGYYLTPTPGKRNPTGGGGSFAPDIVFSSNSRTFVQPFALMLSLATASSNAVIRYTLGTALPATNSPIYTGPLNITNTVQVRARAFAPGLFPGDIHSEQYIAIHSNVVAFKSDLPLMILHNNGGGSVPASADQFVMVQTFQPGTNGFSSLTNVPNDRARGIFHKRGSSTLGYAKSSFFLETQDNFGNDKDETLLGMPSESDWVLYAPNTYDPPLIHNPVSHGLARQMGRYSSRTRFVVVFLKDDSTVGLPVTTNDYNGIYVLEEKYKISSHRVDLDKLDDADTTPPNVTGGYLLTIDRASPGESQFTGGGQKMNYVDPHYAEITAPQRAAQKQYIGDYFNQFGTALNGANYTNPVTGYAPYVDVGAWIDYQMHAVITRNVDAIELSTYLYKPRNGKIAFGPPWDADRSQGGTDGRDFGPRVWICGRSADHFNYSWWGRIFKDPNFWQAWIDRYQQLRRDTYSNTNIFQLIDTMANQVRQEQPRELARWGVNPRTGSKSGCSFSYNFGTTNGYQGEINWLKAWYSNRFDFIDGELEAPPAFSRNGGMVTNGSTLILTGPAGATIHYTLDGSDPRALHGGVATNARGYSGPILLTNNVRVVARCRDVNHHNSTGSGNPPISSPWSGPVAATFYTQVPPLLCTEIMYHPSKPPPPSTTDREEFEFLELKNTGSNAVNLVGLRFTNGLQFAFVGTNGVTNLAPGGYAVLVKNLAAFNTRYSGVTNIVGEYTNSLANSGERLYLEGSFGEPILDFTYADTWVPPTDGGGFSLVVRDETVSPGALSDPASWRRSSATNGSPGRADPPLDTDGDGLPDDWELANGTDPLVADANDDPDHDGMTNWQEYLAGTSPTNSESALLLNVAFNGDVLLTFTAVSNKTYSVLASTNIFAGPWQKRFDVSAAPTNRWLTLDDTNAPSLAPGTSYRLVTPQLP